MDLLCYNQKVDYHMQIIKEYNQRFLAENKCNLRSLARGQRVCLFQIKPSPKEHRPWHCWTVSNNVDHTCRY